MKKLDKAELDKKRKEFNAELLKKNRSFFDEFKEFINKGNVMDLAVGVIIGGAFTTIVTSLVNDILMPIVSLVGGGADFKDLTITIPNLFGGGTSAVIAYGNFLQNVVNFLIVALCVFIIVRTLNRMRERAEKLKNAGKQVIADATPAENEQIILLQEIRDSLKKK